MTMKNSNDTIGNRTRDLPICIAVSQPTAPPSKHVQIEKDNNKDSQQKITFKHTVQALVQHLQILSLERAFRAIRKICWVHARLYAVAQLVEALRYKPEGRGFDFFLIFPFT
jgi:hypothetical protein